MITDTEHPLERVRPSFIEPMQLALVRALPNGGDWLYEAKPTAIAALRPIGPAVSFFGRDEELDSLCGFPKSPVPARSSHRIRSSMVK